MSDFFSDKPGWEPFTGGFSECWVKGRICIETRGDRHKKVCYRACLLWDDYDAPRIKGDDRATVAEAYVEARDLAKLIGRRAS